MVIADASTFPTFPGFNPTLTIMANALRIARGLTGADAPPGRDEDAAGDAPGAPGRGARRGAADGAADGAAPPVLPVTGGGQAVRLLPIAAAAAVGLAGRAERRGSRGTDRPASDDQETP